jgi:hypothetical protein
VSLKSGRAAFPRATSQLKPFFTCGFSTSKRNNSCISSIPEDIREHAASTHREMPCALRYRHQVLTIVSFGECSGPELDVGRIILQMEILAELHEKKRLWICARSDQQGTPGNLRGKFRGGVYK